VVLEFSAPGPELFIFREQVCPEFVIANTLAATTVTHRWSRRRWRKGKDGQPDGALYGLPPIKFHAATRHSVASFLVAAGVPMKTVSELLGQLADQHHGRRVHAHRRGTQA